MHNKTGICLRIPCLKFTKDSMKFLDIKLTHGMHVALFNFKKIKTEYHQLNSTGNTRHVAIK